MKASLKLDMIGQYKAGDCGHPQKVLMYLGVDFKLAIQPSFGDCWWFIDCEYDCELPNYIETMEFTKEQRDFWIEPDL